MKVSLAQIWVHNHEQLAETWKQREGLVRHYASRPIEYPIEMEPNFPDKIRDGRHRVLAATIRGDFEIEAITR
jgi:hypothetical protein